MTARITRVAADAASVGVAVLTVVNLLDWGARRVIGVAFLEILRLNLLGSFAQFLFRPLRGVSWPEGMALSIAAALLLWRRTRLLVSCAVAAALSVWAAAMACAAAYAIDPLIGVFAPLVALVGSVPLARKRSWPVLAMLIVAFGTGIGFIGAQNAALVAGPERRVASPLYGFVPPVVAALAVAWWVSMSKPDVAMRSRRRLIQLWGLGAVSLCLTFSVALESFYLRARAPEPPATRVIDEFAYDVRIEGEPPVVVWTNRNRVQVLDDAYGARHVRHALDENARRVERIWPGQDGDFYVQNGWDIGWWAPASDGQPIPRLPKAWLRTPEWVGETLAGSAAAFAEDPVTKRYLIFSEWLSHYALVERDTGTVVAKGILSDAISPWPYTTVDAVRRVAFISTSMDDGHLYEFDLESPHIVRKAPNLYLYATVLEAPGGLLWGTRPFTGELLAVDTRTLEIRHRVPVEPTVRGIQRDPDTGDLFTCSLMFGNVFRIDRRTLAASKIGWCGRFCRNLFVDARRRTLWVATADGICKIGFSDSSALGTRSSVEDDASSLRSAPADAPVDGTLARNRP